MFKNKKAMGFILYILFYGALIYLAIGLGFFLYLLVQGIIVPGVIIGWPVLIWVLVSGGVVGSPG